MQTAHERLLSAVCTTKDLTPILNEHRALWGDFYPVFDYVIDSYHRHQQSPSVEVLSSKFPDLELSQTDMLPAAALDELKQQFVEEKMMYVFQEAAKKLNQDTSGRVLDYVQKNLSKLNKYTGTNADINITDLNEAEEYYKEINNKPELTGGIPFGIKEIDKFYPTGMAPGHLITLFGYSGKGKSFFADIVAKNAYLDNKNVLILSLEMTAEDTRDRIYTLMGEGKHNIHDFMTGDIINRPGWKNDIAQTGGKIIVLGGEYGKEITPNVVSTKVDEHKIDLVIVDYLQLGMDNNGSKELTPRVMNMSREYKQLARMKNIPVIIVSSVTDDEGKRKDAVPNLKMLAWSRQIEFDASLIMAVHKYDNQGDEKDTVEICCRKNRYGPNFDFLYEVDFARGDWTVIPP